MLTVLRNNPFKSPVVTVFELIFRTSSKEMLEHLPFGPMLPNQTQQFLIFLDIPIPSVNIGAQVIEIVLPYLFGSSF